MSAFKYWKDGVSPYVPPFVRTTAKIVLKEMGNEILLFSLVADEYNPHCCYFPVASHDVWYTRLLTLRRATEKPVNVLLIKPKLLSNIASKTPVLDVFLLITTVLKAEKGIGNTIS